MVKSLLVIVAIGIILLIIGDVLEVKIHYDKVLKSPGTVGKVLSGSGLVEKAKTQFLRVKRKWDLFVAGSDDKKMGVLLGFVDEDAQRLLDSIEEGEHPKMIIPHAELLTESVESLKKQAERVSADALVEYKEKLEGALEKAKSALEKLKKVEEEYESYREYLVRASEALQKSLTKEEEEEKEEESKKSSNEESKETEENKSESESPEPKQDVSKAVPLRF